MSRLLTRSEAADRLRLHVHTLDRLRKDSTGPAYAVVGGRIRYAEGDLDRYVEQHRVTPTSDEATIEAAVQRLVEAAPPLSAETRARLASILSHGGNRVA